MSATLRTNWTRTLILATAGFALAGAVQGQTSPALCPGDIAIIGWIDNGSPDTFAFVTLKPIDPNTVIYFTDNGWTGTAFRNTVNDGDGNEGLCKWRAIAAIAAGTVIQSSDTGNPNFAWTFSGSIPVSGVGAASFTQLALNAGGEQIYAFQAPVTNPLQNPSIHLYVLDDTNGFENATSSGDGSVPPGLSTFFTAITFNQASSTVMAFTTTSLASGSQAVWLQQVADGGNWTFLASGTLPSGTITVNAASPSISRTDTSNNAVTVNGMLGTNEYGPGNAYSYTGGGNGFGGTVGAGTLYMNSDSTNLYVAFQPGASINDVVVIYLDPAGCQSGQVDRSMTDTSSGDRAAISNLTQNVDDRFPIRPDYALTIFNSGTGAFLYRLGTDPNNSHSFISNANVQPSGAGNSSVFREMSIPLSTLGLSAGGTLDFFVAYCATSQFNSNESIPASPALNGSGNPGTAGPTAGYANFGRFVVESPCTAPSIGTQPGNQTVCENGSASFTVSATGTAPLAHQWRRGTSNLTNGGSISGADTATLTINPVALGDAAADYNVVITNACGSVTSNNASLTVTPLSAPTGTGAAPNIYTVDNPPASIVLEAVGGTGAQVAWYSGVCGGAPIGAGNPIVIAPPMATTTYYARWEQGCGVSACASTTVDVRPSQDCGYGWLPGDGIPGTDGIVYSTVVWDPDGAGPSAELLVVGGAFKTAGNVLAENIAIWDGEHWHALGTGVGGAVRALAVFNGDLIAGGEFTTAGGAPANRIARWNGSAWSVLGSGVDNRIHALTVFGSDLVAAGVFTNAGGAPASRTARWNGSTWSPLGTGVDGQVVALTVLGGELVAGGDFANAGGSPASRIARWNGTSWSPFGSGANNWVLALTVSGGDLIAAGDFTTIDGVLAARIARWNGSAWAPLGTGISAGSVDALTVHAGELIAGGTFTTAGGVSVNKIARWNGSAWFALGSGLDNSPSVHALATCGGSLIAGGNITSAGGRTARFIARWNGAVWTPLGGGMSAEANSLGWFGNELIVGGAFTVADGFPASRIARWNGGVWAPLGAGLNNRAYAVTEFAGELFVCGAFTTAGGVAANQIARWNGSAWTSPGHLDNTALALTTFNSELIVAGGFESAGGAAANRVARWNGSTWASLGLGVDAPARALTVWDGALIVGGDFVNAGGVSANHIARWNGSNWSTLGSGLNGTVYALEVYNGNLIACGQFTTAGGVAANGVARWDGSSWTPLGTGLANGAPFALAVLNGELVAGGGFTLAGGIPVNFIARWNGTAWGPLGSGVNNWVNALSVADDTLFVGGSFTAAGGQVSAYVARWGPLGSRPSVTSQPSSETVCPGGAATFSVVANNPGGTPLSYQWRRGTTPLVDGGNIIGAASATLTVNPAGSGDVAGDYNCVVSNPCGGVATSNVSLSLHDTSIATATNGGPYCVGDTIQLTGGPNGMNSYIWSGPNGYSSNAQSPTIASAQLTDSGTYTLTITDTNGCSDSESTTVTVQNCISTGACCLPNGACDASGDQAYCTGLGGVYHGTGSLCASPVVCPQPTNDLPQCCADTPVIDGTFDPNDGWMLVSEAGFTNPIRGGQAGSSDFIGESSATLLYDAGGPTTTNIAADTPSNTADIHSLYLTWDATNLYIAVSGPTGHFTGGGATDRLDLFVAIDTGNSPTSTRTPTKSRFTGGGLMSKNIDFAGWSPDYFVAIENVESGAGYGQLVNAAGTVLASDSATNVANAGDFELGGSRGAALTEVRIAWSALGGTPPASTGEVWNFAVHTTGDGDNFDAYDTAPGYGQGVSQYPNFEQLGDAPNDGDWCGATSDPVAGTTDPSCPDPESDDTVGTGNGILADPSSDNVNDGDIDTISGYLQVRNVGARDTTGPTFTPPASRTVAGSNPVYADAGACVATLTVAEIGTPTALNDNCVPAGNLVTSWSRSDSAPNLTDPFNPGTTTITWTVSDGCNQSSQNQLIEVLSQNLLVIDVSLRGMPPGTLTRCIDFELRNMACDPQTWSEQLTFSAGLTTGYTIAVPCGQYKCLTAQDALHTLTRRLDNPGDLTIVAKKWDASFTTATTDLIGGDLYDDNLVDIVDFGVYVAAWGWTGSGSTDCSTLWPHPDVNGDGAQGAGDLAFILTNFLQYGPSPCTCTAKPAALRGPRTSIAVRKLAELGLSELADADLNFDGVLDTADVQAFLNGARPKQHTVKPSLSPLDVHVSGDHDALRE